MESVSVTSLAGAVGLPIALFAGCAVVARRRADLRGDGILVVAYLLLCAATLAAVVWWAPGRPWGAAELLFATPVAFVTVLAGAVALCAADRREPPQWSIARLTTGVAAAAVAAWFAMAAWWRWPSGLPCEQRCNGYCWVQAVFMDHPDDAICEAEGDICACDGPAGAPP